MLNLKGDLEDQRNAKQYQRIARLKYRHLGKLGNQQDRAGNSISQVTKLL